MFSVTCQVDIGVLGAAPLHLLLTQHPRLAALAHLVHRVAHGASLVRRTASPATHLHRRLGAAEPASRHGQASR